MTTKQKLKTHLIDYDEKRYLELFKKKADELSEIALTIPWRYRQDAKDFFFQYCVGLRDILDISQEYEKTEAIESHSSNLETVLLENANEFPVLLKNSARNVISPEKPVSTCIQSQYNIDASNTYSVKEEETDLNIEQLQLCKDLADEESKTVKPISGWKKEGNALRGEKEIAKGDESVKLLNTVTNVYSHTKDSRVVETKDDDTEAMLECCEESADEGSSIFVHNGGHASNRLDKTSINGKEDHTTATAESEHTLELTLPQNSNGQGNVCNIAELLECIPQLSQYMQLDPKHVTVLRDGTDEEENYIHLSVELADGTVQELKIAGYIPTCSMSEGTDTDVKPTVIELTKETTEPVLDIQVKQEENDHEAASEYEKDDGLSIMNRKLRCRKKKIEIKRKGPGRPKNENIPEPVTNEKGERVYICEECMASVKTYNALIVHMRTHTGSRPFHCSYCGKSFTTKGNMKSHEMTGHTDNKPWKCKFCEKCFKEKKVMRIHERIHTGERPYSCSICEKAFNQRSVMLEHMLTHSNNKPHLCDFCGQGFRGISSLKAHKKRHLGLREFQCDSCERAFICRNELKRHILTHTGDRPYACDVCSKAFTRLSYLKEHSNLHTGSKPFKCVDCGISFSDTMSLHRHKKKHKLEKDFPEIGPVTIVNVNCEDVGDESFTAVEVPDQVTINGEETSIQVLVDENTSMEDFQKLQSLLLSATANAELMINSQNTSKQLYQVVCVNPDTQEVVGQVEGQEVIVAGQPNDVTSMDLQYTIS